MERLEFLIKVVLQDGTIILLNGLQVCSIERASDKLANPVNLAKLRMSNGDEWIVKNPLFDSWEADTF